MKAEQLWASILQEAIQGKLVPQLDSEPEVEQIGDVPEDVPFTVPSKWRWVYLSSIVQKLTDGEHKTPKYVESGIPFLSVKNISSGKINFENTKFVTEGDYLIFRKRCNPEAGDILLSKVGTTGVPAIVKNETKFALFVSVALIKLNQRLVDTNFMYWLLCSPLVQMQVKANTRGIGNKNWVLKSIAATKLVLPSIKEQRRIVSRLNELRPLVEYYGKEQEQLGRLATTFPDKLKASLLQYAIQGKLVPQLGTEPAVKQIGDVPEQLPFAIPESWGWRRLADIQILVRGVTFPGSSKSKIPFKGGVRCLTTGSVQKQYKSESDVFIPTDVIKKDSQYLAHGDVVISSANSRELVGKSMLWDAMGNDDHITFGGFLTVARANDDVDAEFLAVLYKWLFYSGKFAEVATQTTNIANISNKVISSIFVPLPSIPEQRRIVLKLNALLPKVDNIQGQM